MASIIDVAKYILLKKGEVTTRKLHKLCYYSQAWSLVWTDKQIFSEDFMAFASGPVCDELYEFHKDIFVLKDGDLGKFDSSALNEDEIETIDIILRYYGDDKPYQLAENVHQESPWIEARCGLLPGKDCRNIISKESMQKYYSSLKGNDEVTEKNEAI